MKPTAKNIAKYVNDKLDKSKENWWGGDNIYISLPKLNKNTLEALRNNYNFTTVKVEIFGYVYFKRDTAFLPKNVKV